MSNTALIEKGKDGTYSVYTADTGAVIVGEGATVAEAKADFELALQEYHAFYKEKGEEAPEDFSEGFVYKYDIASVFNYFDFINVSKFAKRIGINPSLLRQYKAGDTYISELQAQKIQQAFREVGAELSAISL